MKRIASFFLSVLLVLPLTFHIAAAESYVKMATTEKTIVYERASTKSDEVLTVKEGFRFTPVGETESFWKVEIRRKNTSETYTGYIRKKHAEEYQASSSTDTASSTARGSGNRRGGSAPSSPAARGSGNGNGSSVSSPSAAQPRTVYWVTNGKVYHSTQSCATLKRSSNIQNGTISGSGKERACKVCS